MFTGKRKPTSEGSGSDTDELQWSNKDTTSSLLYWNVNSYEVPSPTSSKNNDNIENVGSRLKRYPFEGGEVIVLPYDMSVYFHGECELTVLFGAIEVFGSTLTVNDEPAKVFSPNTHSYLPITNINSGTAIKRAHLARKLVSIGVKEAAIEAILEMHLLPESSVVTCRSVDGGKTSFLENLTSRQLYPTSLKNCRWSFSSTTGWKYDPRWEEILEKCDENSKVMFFGGKSVGKSTLLRYIVNRLLGKHEKVCVIDLDPGQSEFTVPGCVSVVIVDKPLLGPNFTHLTKPERCIFIPNISVGDDMPSYLRCTKELIKQSKQFSNMPILVNTMGYPNLDLAAFSIKQLWPTLVVQIETKENSNFSGDLVPTIIGKCGLYLENDIPSDLNYDFLKIRTSAPLNAYKKERNRRFREMCIYSYFSQMLPNGIQSLGEKGVKKFRLDLEDVKIISHGSPSDPMESRAKIVALCNLEKIEDNIQVFNCYGWGIVRDVSVEAGHLILMTPITQEELLDIDYLVIGSVVLPEPLENDSLKKRR